MFSIREDLMARSCAVCGKVSIDGFNPQSSGMNRVRAHRRYHPNLQRATIEQDGKMVKTLVCTRCQRTLSRGAR
jgi:ribosomal protein L28